MSWWRNSMTVHHGDGTRTGRAERGGTVFALDARLAIRKTVKLIRLMRVRRWAGGLRYGVAASIEHDAVDFGHDFRTVLDVGANVGQFALFSLERFPRASVTCFEPLPEAKHKLDRVIAGAPRARAFQLALGASAAHLAMHVSASPDSSSLYPITSTQSDLFENTHEERIAIVDVVSLDSWEQLQPLTRPALLKIDTQGYELEVLRGAARTLEVLDEIVLEGSFIELYTGQALADELVCYLRERGWRLHGLHSLTRDRSGRCIQADLHFVRATV